MRRLWIRSRFSVFLGLALLVFSASLVAQMADQRPKPGTATATATATESKRAEEAHRALGTATVDPAREAARRTEDFAPGTPGDRTDPVVPRNGFIDHFIFSSIKRDRIPHAGLASDEELVRRIYLDAIGLPPSVDAVRAYVADRAPDKAARLIDSLVGSEEFAEQWAWFWTDLFRISGEAGPASRRAFSFWLKEQLRADRPYDRWVYDLLTPSTKAHATVPSLAFIGRANQLKSRFVHSADDFGIHNRLDSLDQINVDVHRSFLGINTSCVSCHDGANHLEQVNLYLTRKKREEFYRTSAFFGKTNLIGNWNDKIKNVLQDLHVDDLAKGYDTANDAPYYTMAESQFPRLEGKAYTPAFMLTGEEPRPGQNERAELARMVTSHPQFARATVNMLWGKLMTVAFVEPWDSFDLDRLDPKKPPPAPWTVQPLNPELLEALAADFRKSGHSIHHVIKTIMKSSAYQLSAKFPAEWNDKYARYYPRKYIRVLTGPELVDSIATVTDKPTGIQFSGVRTSRVKQLVGPEDLGRRGGGAPIDALMQSFYQSNRRTPPPEGNKASTLQAMLMMRSTVVSDRVIAKDGGRLQELVSSNRTADEVIEEIFLATLARRPSTGELDVARGALAADRVAGAENLQWALFNTPEFLTNH